MRSVRWLMLTWSSKTRGLTSVTPNWTFPITCVILYLV
jgi:hypothetical protein